jgi:pyruvate kinase
VCSSAVKTAIDMKAAMIVVLSESGSTARAVAKYRPPCPVLVMTGTPQVGRQAYGYLRGCSVRVLGSMRGSESILVLAGNVGKENGWLKSGDSIICIHGETEERTGMSNLVKVVTVE